MNAPRHAPIQLACVLLDVGGDRGPEVVAIESLEEVGLDARAGPVEIACPDQLDVLLRLPHRA